MTRLFLAPPGDGGGLRRLDGPQSRSSGFQFSLVGEGEEDHTRAFEIGFWLILGGYTVT